jgi:hypothetical protein
MVFFLIYRPALRTLFTPNIIVAIKISDEKLDASTYLSDAKKIKRSFDMAWYPKQIGITPIRR